MLFEIYFYNSSREYLDSISTNLFKELVDVISKLPKRETQSEINKDLFWLLTADGWSYDIAPAGIDNSPPKELALTELSIDGVKRWNNRNLCLTSTTMEAKWHADFAKIYNGKLVQIEAQFGKVESMFKDFCGFKIGRFERRLTLGAEIVLCEPNKYFSHRKKSISGMAYFNVAKQSLPAIGLDCPILLLGIKT